MGKIKEIIRGSVREEDSDDDEMDKAIKELEKEELRRARLARLREYRLEAEKRARELEKELKSLFMANSDKQKEPGSDISPADIEIAKLISNMPEEERAKMIAIVSMLKAAGKSDSSAAVVLPILMSAIGNQSKTNRVDVRKEEDGSVSPSDIEIAKLISHLPEEERTKMIATVSLLKAAGKSDSALVALLPLVMSMSGRSPSAEIKATEQVQQKLDVGSLLTGIASIIQALKDEKDKELMSQVINIALSKLMEQPQPQPVQTKSSLEEFFSHLDKLEKLAAIFGGRSDPEYLKIMKELEEMKIKHDLAMKKLELDSKVQVAKMQEEKEKQEKIVEGLKKVISSVAEAAAEAAEAVESGEVLGKSDENKPISVMCEKCGRQFIIPPDAVEFVCPSCGTMYSKKQEKS
jgi:predicted RNA-binding Zn-ribbon protein involved in translation (DUF1610 family)